METSKPIEKPKRQSFYLMQLSTKALINFKIPSESLKEMYIDFGCEKIEGYKKRAKVPLGLDDSDYIRYLEKQNPYDIDIDEMYYKALEQEEKNSERIPLEDSFDDIPPEESGVKNFPLEETVKLQETVREDFNLQEKE